MAEKLNATYEAAERQGTRESNTDRLRSILEEPQLRSLFRDFLRSNFCEENLSFWLDVKDFKRKFNITSSANAAATPVPRGGNSRTTPGQAAMERHHESLIRTAVEINNKYLAPSSPHELNIDHGLRNELAGYLNDVMKNIGRNDFQGHMSIQEAQQFNATQLASMIRLYERIQTHVFRLMATDSVPKANSLPSLILSDITDYILFIVHYNSPLPGHSRLSWWYGRFRQRYVILDGTPGSSWSRWWFGRG